MCTARRVRFKVLETPVQVSLRSLFYASGHRSARTLSSKVSHEWQERETRQERLQSTPARAAQNDDGSNLLEKETNDLDNDVNEALGRASSPQNEIDIMMSTPTWSIRSLLPTHESSATATKNASDNITPTQLHHLLRLSALPLPANERQERKMLSDLRAQLHFVRQIQHVDTRGVEPLTSIRDESPEAQKERVIGLDALREALGKEEIVGAFHKRIRRRKTDTKDEKIEKAEAWDVLGCAERRVGRFFVVDAEDT